MDAVKQAYQRASKRLFLLDYDGTLAGLKPTPPEAKPTARLLQVLAGLAADPRNTVVVVSGRDADTLDDWLGDLPLSFVAEHGFMYKAAGHPWRAASGNTGAEWKPAVRALMQALTDKVPGSLTEEKTNALVWHYRAATDHTKAIAAARALYSELTPLAQPLRLRVLAGKEVVEVQPAGINKGAAAQHWLQRDAWGFILAAGDDVTDEDLFKTVPLRAFSIKIGAGNTAARLRLARPADLLKLLESFR